MTFTAYRTWVSGEVVTAAEMNAQVRDNGNSIVGAAASYSCTWGATTTNPSLGTGTLVANFRQDSKWVDVDIQVIFGSSTTPGAGLWSFTLPVAARRSRWLREATAFDNSATATYPLTVDASTSSQVAVRAYSGTAGNPQQNAPGSAGAIPFAWATSDIIAAQFRYEAA